jgi:hypothetical protein
MKRLAFLAIPFLSLATPAVSADLGPYPERGANVAPPLPYYYEPAPVYVRPFYVMPRAYYYGPRFYGVRYPRPYVYSYAKWRGYPRGPYWHYRHRWW